MPRPYSPPYSPVRLSETRTKRTLSSDEPDCSTSGCSSSYSSSTSSSSIPSPDDNSHPPEDERDPFGLEFSLSHLQLEREGDELDYFPSVRTSLALPAAAAAVGAGPKHRAAHQHQHDHESHDPTSVQASRSWEGVQDAPTPRQEQGPRSRVTPSAADRVVELDSYPFLSQTASSSSSSSSAATTSPPIDDPSPIPLPHLHLIPRPPPTPAVRKYSSGLLTTTRALFQLSLSPNPSPSRDASTSYFPGEADPFGGGGGTGRGQNNASDSAGGDEDEGDWSPALSTGGAGADGRPAHGQGEDGAFALLQDEGSSDRRFERLRRESEDRQEALRVLRASVGQHEEEEELVPPPSVWTPGHGRNWSEGDEGLGDEGVHHVEFSGYP